MNTGMIRGESNEFYHSTGAVSASTIKDFLKRPMLFFAKHVAKTAEKPSSAAMEFGSAAHEYILQPDEFKRHYAFLPPEYDGRTKAGKEIKAELEAQGVKTLTQSDCDDLMRLADAVHSNPVAAALFAHGEAEISWRIQTEAFAMQSRTDWFIDAVTEQQAIILNDAGIDIKVNQPVIVDLKTTQDLDDWSRDNYSNAVYKFGYQIQLALYLAVVNRIRKAEGKEIVRHFLFCVVEKNAPWECAVIALDEISFGLAQTQLKDALKRLTYSYQSGDWGGYAKRGVIVCGVPQHIAGREEQAIFEAKTFEDPSQWS